MKKSGKNYMFTILGIVLIMTGLFLLKTLASTHELILILPYILFGIGCSILGYGTSSILSQKAFKNHPEIQKQLMIDKTDERNIAIANRAKAKAYDMMIFVVGALLLTFALMRIDIIAMLLLLFVYLFAQGYGIYFRCKYDKEM